MMDPDADNDGSKSTYDEQIINIVVIKDPSDWNQNQSHDESPPFQAQINHHCDNDNRSRSSRNPAQNNSRIAYPSNLYKSQSFTVGALPSHQQYQRQHHPLQGYAHQQPSLFKESEIFNSFDDTYFDFPTSISNNVNLPLNSSTSTVHSSALTVEMTSRQNHSGLHQNLNSCMYPNVNNINTNYSIVGKNLSQAQSSGVNKACYNGRHFPGDETNGKRFSRHLSVPVSLEGSIASLTGSVYNDKLRTQALSDLPQPHFTSSSQSVTNQSMQNQLTSNQPVSIQSILNPLALNHSVSNQSATHQSTSVTHQSASVMHQSASRQSALCSPYLTSPALFSTKDVKSLSSTPMAVATTPDSGFCTPSLHSAPLKILVNSTPNILGNEDIDKLPIEDFGNFSPIAGEKSLESLFNNSLLWDETEGVDSLLEDEGDGQASLDSSLRSVNWLKTFPIGESIMPLNVSPPAMNSAPLNVSPPAMNSAPLENRNQSVESLTIQGIQRTNSDGALKEKTSCVPVCLPFPALPKPIPVIMANQNLCIPRCSNAGAQEQSVVSSSTIPTATSQTEADEIKPKTVKQRKSTKKTIVTRPGDVFQRPAHSYADLIKLALKSSIERKLTYRAIIAWIETHFPYYKHEATPSWKNTLKHTLSLQSDFVRTGTKSPSIWTLSTNAVHHHLQPVTKPPEIPSHVMMSLNKSKRIAPQPILPKLNTYALVPLQNLSQTGGLVQLAQNPRQPQPKFHTIRPNPVQPHQEKAIAVNDANPSYVPSSEICSEVGPCKKPRAKQKVQKSSSSASGKSSGKCLPNGLALSLGSGQSLALNSAGNGKSLQKKTPALKFSTGSKSRNSLAGGRSNQNNAKQLANNQEDYSGNEHDMIIGFNDQDRLSQHSCSVMKQSLNNYNTKEMMSVLNRKDYEGPFSKKMKKDLIRKNGKAAKGCSGIISTTKAGSKRKISFSRTSGPVMNLQHALQKCHEDQLAAETIGQMLVEEDKKSGRSCSEYVGSESHFTQMKEHPHPLRQNTDSVDQWPTASASLTQESFHPTLFNQYCHSVPNYSVSTLNPGDHCDLSSVAKKSNIMKRANIIKNKSLAQTDRLKLTSRSLSFESNNSHHDKNLMVMADKQLDPSVQVNFVNAQHAFSLEHPEPLALPLSNQGSKKNNFNSEKLDGLTGASHLPCPKLYRTRSRRKQVHVPLTTEISPNRNYRDYFEDIDSSPDINSKKRATVTVNSCSGNAAVRSSSPSVDGIPSSSINKTNASGSETQTSFLFPSAPVVATESPERAANISLGEDPPPFVHFLSSFPRTSDFDDVTNKENENAQSHSVHRLAKDRFVHSSPNLRSFLTSTLSPHLLTHPTDSASVNDLSVADSMCTPPCGNISIQYSQSHPPAPSSCSYSSSSSSSATFIPTMAEKTSAISESQTMNSQHQRQHQDMTSSSMAPICQPSPPFSLSISPILAPQSMVSSTPNRSSVQNLEKPSAEVGLQGSSRDDLDISPLPGSGINILDSSFLEHLETFISDLDPALQ